MRPTVRPALSASQWWTAASWTWCRVMKPTSCSRTQVQQAASWSADARVVVRAATPASSVVTRSGRPDAQDGPGRSVPRQGASRRCCSRTSARRSGATPGLPSSSRGSARWPPSRRPSAAAARPSGVPGDRVDAMIYRERHQAASSASPVACPSRRTRERPPRPRARSSRIPVDWLTAPAVQRRSRRTRPRRRPPCRARPACAAQALGKQGDHAECDLAGAEHPGEVGQLRVAARRRGGTTCAARAGEARAVAPIAIRPRASPFTGFMGSTLRHRRSAE